MFAGDKEHRRGGRFEDLSAFLAFLERRGQLVRVHAEVDPVLEVTEIVQRVIRENGPALLFERPKGAAFPLAINLFGTAERVEWALGRPPAEIGQELVHALKHLNPPTLRGLWRSRTLLRRALVMRPRRVRRAPVQEVSEEPDLEKLPILKCWPEDGGRFITFGLVLTEHPKTHRRNVGLYRLHVFGRDRTGMHWQSLKGGRAHYAEAEGEGRPLPAAVVLGGDPALLLSAILPLPEDFDEIAFAGFLRGRPIPMVRARTIPLLVPAHAEFILEGIVPPYERQMEGPFGDHFGHYSEASPFPVFCIHRITHRRAAIYPATVVGKPPQEDKYLGIAATEMIGPLVRLLNPNVVDLWAFPETGFHNLLGVALRERHPKEALKTAFALLGLGQLALTKVMILVREDVNCRSVPALLRELWFRFEPQERMLLLPTAPLDTLDFTSFVPHVGGKLILDATGERIENAPPPTDVTDPRTLDPRIRAFRLLEGGVLVLSVEREARAVLADLLHAPALGPIKILIAVSPDVPLEDDEHLLWGIFTRFDPARDVLCAEMHLVGARPLYRGRMAFDATWKEGYPRPLEMCEDIVRLVDRRWSEYFPAGTLPRPAG